MSTQSNFGDLLGTYRCVRTVTGETLSRIRSRIPPNLLRQLIMSFLLQHIGRRDSQRTVKQLIEIISAIVRDPVQNPPISPQGQSMLLTLPTTLLALCLGFLDLNQVANCARVAFAFGLAASRSDALFHLPLTKRRLIFLCCRPVEDFTVKYRFIRPESIRVVAPFGGRWRCRIPRKWSNDFAKNLYQLTRRVVTIGGDVPRNFQDLWRESLFRILPLHLDLQVYDNIDQFMDESDWQTLRSLKAQCIAKFRHLWMPLNTKSTSLNVRDKKAVLDFVHSVKSRHPPLLKTLDLRLTGAHRLMRLWLNALPEHGFPLFYLWTLPHLERVTLTVPLCCTSWRGLWSPFARQPEIISLCAKQVS